MMKDDVPEEIKQRRLREIIDTFQITAAEKMRDRFGHEYTILVDGFSKKDPTKLKGRTDGNLKCIVQEQADNLGHVEVGDWIKAKVLNATSGTLHVKAIRKTHGLFE